MHGLPIRQKRAYHSFCSLAWIISGLYVLFQRGRLEKPAHRAGAVLFRSGILAVVLLLGRFGAWMHKALAQALQAALRPSGHAAHGFDPYGGCCGAGRRRAAAYSAAVCWLARP